ncbi:MAG: ABC transporter ATP-binding protein [Desulfobacteraceae bacterium]|jgi:peptide/nickel transport system ATP-binding protein
MPLLSVDNLSITYRTRRGLLTAVDRASFTLEKGQTLGLVGESGSGKSTIGTAIMRLLPGNASIPSGRIELSGIDLLAAAPEQIRQIRWNKISMIFQAAMNAMNPIQRVGEQIAETIRFHEPDLPGPDVQNRVAELFDLVGIPKARQKDYPHQYSGGMRQRAVIAMALACRPEIIIADEPTTALDVIVQDQILQTLRKLQRTLGIGIVLISHDIAVVADTCDHIGVMYAGQLVELGTRSEVFHAPAHPYTKALLAAHITLDNDRRDPAPIPGNPPDMVALPPGCRFCDRCPCQRDSCGIDPPGWQNLTATHKIRCCHPAPNDA